MSSNNSLPLPIFDTLQYIATQTDFNYLGEGYYEQDIRCSLTFLTAYKGSQGTFNAYRREIERLLHWCALVANKSLKELRREDIESYISFCQNPPLSWIGLTKPPRFIETEGKRQANPKWRPFNATVPKAARRRGVEPKHKHFELANSSLRELFAILNSFFNYLILEEHVYMNPVAMIRQKSQYIRKNHGQPKIRRLSELQWQYVIKTTEQQACLDPKRYERSLFIMSALYSMYLRISELAANTRWCPTMNNFTRDGDGFWWFTTVGKGNKERKIAVSDAMLNALRRWRQHLGLPPLPSPADNSPLLPKTKGKGPIKSINFIRRLVQECFDAAINQLQLDGLSEEADTLNEATVHWLRHTGISDDVKIRPREHVRDDAGHSSSAITDKYIDIELRERHQSARKKIIAEKD